MPKEEKIGEAIFKESLKGKEAADGVLSDMEKEIVSLNKEVSKNAEKLYDFVFRQLSSDNAGIIENNIRNMSLVQRLTSGLEPILTMYRQSYGKIMRSFRGDMFAASAEKENRISKQLAILGIKEDRAELNQEAFGTIALLGEKNFKRIDSILRKWKDTIYDVFISGIVRGHDVISFRKLFFNKDGSIKVGSSLDEALQESMITAVEERTAFNRAKAKENKYDYCWNSNPLDAKTKPVCIDASLAGVIPEGQMATEHGFPPRFLCRCEVVYTRGEWVGINKAINDGIRERRSVLLDALWAAPKQRRVWKWRGKKIYPTDDAARAGTKLYKDIEHKIALVNGLEVEDFIFKEGAL